MTDIHTPPIVTPARIFDTLFYGRVRTDALKAAIELGVFTAIGEGFRDAIGIAGRCEASPRGIEALCDFLSVEGFLSRSHDRYDQGDEARLFLDRRSPAYVGDVTTFFCSPLHVERSAHLTDIVRHGGSPSADILEPDALEWQRFAESMVPVMRPVAAATAERLGVAAAGKLRVLDIAAGHGEYGIALARANPAVSIVALDWPVVLDVAKRRASEAGVGARYDTIAGSAFDVELDGPYDIILLPNFLHHFGPDECERLLVKLRAALTADGRLATVEFVPNEDRVSPAWPAMFALTMLMLTPAGRAYTLLELYAMLERSGYSRNTSFPLPLTPQTLVVSHVD